MNNKIVKDIKKNNPNKTVAFSVLGTNSANKFTQAIKKNKEFVNSVILIGKKILSLISIPACATNLGYEWGKIGKEGLFLIKRLSDSVIKIDCIPFDILGILAIRKNLFSLFDLSFPTLPGLPTLPEFPDLNIINKLLTFSDIDIVTPIKEIIESLNMDDINHWWEPDYVYNKRF